MLDIPLDAIKGLIVDDCRRKTGVVGGIADLQLVSGRQQAVFDLRPQRLRHVHSRTGAALLSAELERASDRSVDHRSDVGTGMDEMVVFTAALADQTWEIYVSVDILTDLRP